jgi:hypothetical protein
MKKPVPINRYRLFHGVILNAILTGNKDDFETGLNTPALFFRNSCGVFEGLS